MKPLSRTAIRISAAVFWTLALVRLVWLYESAQGVDGWDYAIYDLGVERAFSGEDPYRQIGIETGFINHPGLLLVAYPFHLLGAAGSWVWLAASLIAWLAAVFLSFRAHERRAELLVLLFSLTAAAEGLFAGQAGIPAVLCLAVAYRFHRREKEIAAGILIGLAAVFKLSLGVFILFFLLKKRFGAAAAGLATLVLFSATAEWLLFPGINGLFFVSMAGLVGSAYPGVHNASLYHPSFTPVIGAFMLASLAWVVYRRGDRVPERLAFGGFAAWTLLTSPLTWHHHFVLLALPLAWLLAERPWVGIALAGLIQIDLLGQRIGLPFHTGILAAVGIYLLFIIIPYAPLPGNRSARLPPPDDLPGQHPGRPGDEFPVRPVPDRHHHRPVR